MSAAFSAPLLAALLMAAGVAHASDFAALGALPPPPGHTRAVSPLRIDTPPVIDGFTDDEVWREAPRAEDFWISEWQQPPSERTEVRVLYDGAVLYFAFHCFDALPASIRAQQQTRNAAIGLDDHVTVEVDPYHDHRMISRFSVTARGTQSDVFAGGRANKAEWRGEWQAAAQRTAYGWSAEFAIPIQILSVPGTAHTIGINFVRYHSRTQEWSRWADVTQQARSEESGHLTDLRLSPAPAAHALTVMQYASGGLSGRGADTPAERFASTGVDLRHVWRGGLNTVAALNPDFRQTDSDVVGLAFDYNEKFRNEHRPFFQEGRAFFDDPSVFHSGRIEDFDLGVKSFGRIAEYELGALAVASGRDGYDFVARLRRELRAGLGVSGTVVASERGTMSNQVVKAEVSGDLNARVRFHTDLAGTSTTGEWQGMGLRASGGLGVHLGQWTTRAYVERVDAAFYPADGFIAGDLAGTSGAGGSAAYSRGFGAGWLKRAEGSLALDLRQTQTGLLQREQVSLYGSAETWSNVRLTAGITTGDYRPRGATRQSWQETINQDRFYTAGGYHNMANGRLGYGATFNWGDLGGEAYRHWMPSLWLSPTAHVAVAYSYERADHGETHHQSVLSGTFELTSQQALSARWVDADGGYYRVAYRRVVKRGIDAFAVFSRDPYVSDSFSMKLVWTVLPPAIM